MAEQDFLCKLCAVIKANYFLFENYQRIVQLEAHFKVISYKFKRGLTLLTKNEAAFYCSFPRKVPTNACTSWKQLQGKVCLFDSYLHQEYHRCRIPGQTNE